MYRVAIVDDEPVIRFGIKASVDWGRENIGLAGDFANGSEAWRVIGEDPVDILITDIKMPVMDGLELTRKTLERHPRTKVILVSSYNDFEYVRQGLQLGVVDYLLKPTLEPEGLLELVRRCLRLIEDERQHDQDRQLIRLTRRSNDRKKLESLVRKALAHGESPEPTAGALPEWLENGYAACTALIDGLRETEERFGSLHAAVLLEEMHDLFDKAVEDGVAFQAGSGTLAFAFARTPGSGTGPAETVRRLRSLWRDRLGVAVTVGYAVGRGTEGLRPAFQESAGSAERRFFEGSGEYGPAEARLDAGDRAPAPAVRLLRELKAAVLARDAEAADGAVRAWIARWASSRPSPETVRREAFEIVTAMFLNEQETIVLLEGFEELKRSETLAGLVKLLLAQIKGYRAAYAAGSHTYSGNKQLIDKAVSYIARHYAGEITLQQLADHVHMSKNYFCLQFKHHTGYNFIDYLIRLRIGKAKELIGDPGLKIYEVAEKAGFNDVKYFSKLFKKTTGSSPIEYRERMSARD